MSDPIEVRIGGKTVQEAIAANDLQAINRLSAALTTAARLARTMRARAMRGDFASQPRPYSTRRPYIISESYAQAIGTRKRSYAGSEAMHGETGRTIPGNITGGMWGGLRVRNFGAVGAVIEFAGRSLGSRIKANKRGTNQRVQVANRLKGAQVWKRLRINPIQPTIREIQGVGTALTALAARALAFGGRTQITSTSGDAILARELVADIEAGRVTRYL